MAASSNVTLDDSSSLLVYDPPDAWTSPSGNDAQAYMNSTFHGTSIEGATAKLTFNGTGVWLYGAKQPDYGSFIFSVDNEVSAFTNATASEAAYGQLLAGVSNLAMGEHVVTIMNGGSGPIDLDSIVYETVSETQQDAPPQGSSDPTSSSTGSDTQSSQTSSSPASTPSGRLSAKPNAVTGAGNDDTTADAPPAGPTAAPITAPVDAPTESNTAPVDAPPPTTQAAAGAQPTGQQEASSAAATPIAASPNAVAPSSTESPGVTAAFNSVQPSSQAERMSNPSVAGTSQPKRGLPKGAVIGIIVGCAVLLLLIAALLFMLLRRRRRARNVRRKGLASPVLPLQDPEKESYFFGGQGAMADKRTQYLDRSPPSRMSQYSNNTAATLGGYGGPHKEPGLKAMPTPPPPIFVRDSSYTSQSSETATLNGDDDGYDIADVYSHMYPGAPVRPPRPPELRLSV